MTKADTWEAGLLNLVFLNTDFTGLGDAGGLRGSVAPGSIYISLHTADPTDGGSQTSSETAYAPYARVAVGRSGANWTVSGTTPTSVSPDADITFATCTATPGGNLTHFGVGTAATGAGKLMYSGTLSPNVVMNTGVQPKVTTASTITED